MKGKTVNERIKLYLQENGIKQSFVAEKAGLTTYKVNRLCNGYTSIEILDYYKICRALNVPLETFVEGV